MYTEAEFLSDCAFSASLNIATLFCKVFIPMLISKLKNQIILNLKIYKIKPLGVPQFHQYSILSDFSIVAELCQAF